MTTKKTPAKNGAWASSLAEVKRLAEVNITTPSTARFTVRPLTLDELAAANGLPDDLLRVALLEMIPGGVVAEISDKLRQGDPDSLQAARKLSEDTMALRDRIVLAAVVAPKLKPSDLPSLDPFDKAMIAGIAQRRIVEDAAGKAVGADSLASFRAAGEVE